MRNAALDPRSPLPASTLRRSAQDVAGRRWYGKAKPSLRTPHSNEPALAAESSAVANTERNTLHDRLRLMPDAVAERLVEAVRRGATVPEVARILLVEINAILEDEEVVQPDA